MAIETTCGAAASCWRLVMNTPVAVLAVPNAVRFTPFQLQSLPAQLGQLSVDQQWAGQLQVERLARTGNHLRPIQRIFTRAVTRAVTGQWRSEWRK